MVVVDHPRTPVLGLANDLYSYTRLDSHLALQSPRAATHGWDPSSKLGAHRLCKGKGVGCQ